jgi:cytochrome c-type biogenesis protein CcmH/NrfF
MWRKSAPSLVGLLAAASLAAQTPPRAAAFGPQDSVLGAAVSRRTGDSLGRLEVPEAAGRAMQAVTARDNSPLVKDIEEKIRCTCGCNLSVYTCRTTDFSCTTSPAMHRLVLARLDSGMTPAEVLASFERQYGEMIFMEPPKRGFNWAAYVMPFIGLGIGIGLVVGVVRRWARATPAAGGADEAGAAPGGLPGVSEDDMEKLKRELERFEA